MPSVTSGMCMNWARTYTDRAVLAAAGHVS